MKREIAVSEEALRDGRELHSFSKVLKESKGEVDISWNLEDENRCTNRCIVFKDRMPS